VTLAAVVAKGDRKASLEALRDTLAGSIEVAESKEVAALARQLQSVLAELDALAAPVEADDVVTQFRGHKPTPRKSGAARTAPASGDRRK
jgi:hypothetical protein